MDVSRDLYLEKGEQNREILDYRRYVLKINSEEDLPPQELLELSEKANQDFPNMELPKVSIIRALLKKGDVYDALKRTKDLLKTSDNKSAIIVEVWLHMPDKYSGDAEKLIDLFAEKDERVLSVQGMIYLHRYQESDTKEKQLLIDALNCFKEANKMDSKYTLSTVLACEVLKELNSEERFLYYRNFVKNLTMDYGFPLLCAEYAMLQDDVKETIQYFGIFIRRFEQYHLSGVKFDFYIKMYELNNIISRAERIVQYLQCKAENNEYLQECAVILEKNKHIPLRESVQATTIIQAFDKGEMPQGNIIVGEPLDIVSGFYIFK